MSFDPIKEYHESQLDKHSRSYKTTIAALDVVRQFIIDRKRILVGGMMMDMALGLKGDRIYGPDELPDYDFISPNHYRDAYDIGQILCEQKFDGVSVIPARHTTTMKVRVNFEEAADITYCPANMYEKIPTLVYDQFVIRHPHVQMIDQHLSLSKPYTNPGMEVIFDRWKKDCVRYDMLYKHYPVGRPITSPPNIPVIPITADIKMKELGIDKYCVAGWSAYFIWVDLFSACGDSPDPCKRADPSTTKFQTYKGHARVTLLSRQPIDECSSTNTRKIYNQLFDQQPRRMTATVTGTSQPACDVELLDTSDIRVTAHRFGNRLWVSNLQYVMVYLLVRIVYTGYAGSKDEVEHAKKAYLYCRHMIANAHKLPNNIGHMFQPTHEVFGVHDESSSTVIYKESFRARLNNKPRPRDTPQPKYPQYPDCMIDAKFDVINARYFQIDGELCTVDQSTQNVCTSSNTGTDMDRDRCD